MLINFLTKKSVKFKLYNKRISLKRFSFKNKNLKLGYKVKVRPFKRRQKFIKKSFLVKIQKLQKPHRFWLQPRITKTRRQRSTFNKKTSRIFKRRRTWRIKRSFVTTVKPTIRSGRGGSALKKFNSVFTQNVYKRRLRDRFTIKVETAAPLMFTKHLFSISKYKKLLLSSSLYRTKKLHSANLIKFHLNHLTRKYLLKKKNIKSKITRRRSRRRFKSNRLNRLKFTYRVGSHSYARLGHSWSSKLNVFKIGEFTNRLITLNFIHLLKLSGASKIDASCGLTNNLNMFGSIFQLAIEFSNLHATCMSSSSVLLSLRRNLWFNHTTLLNTFKNRNILIELGVRGGITERYRSGQNIFTGPTINRMNVLKQIILKVKKTRLTNIMRQNANLYTHLKRYNVKVVNSDNKSLYHYSRIPTNTNKSFLKKHFTLFLASLQISGYIASSNFKNLLGRHKKPSIFTYRTTLKNYLFTYTMIAQRSSPHFFWNGTCLSRSVEFKNGLLSNSFLLNFNENFWENALYLKPKSGLNGVLGAETGNNFNIMLRRVLATSIWGDSAKTSSKNFNKSIKRAHLRRRHFGRFSQLHLKRFKINRLINKLPNRLHYDFEFNKYTKLNAFNNKRISVKVKRFLAKKKFYKKPRRFLLTRRFASKRTGKKGGRKANIRKSRKMIRRILRRARPLSYLKLKFVSRLLRTDPSQIKKNLISELSFVTRNGKLLTKKFHKYIKGLSKTKDLKKKLKTKVIKSAFRKFKKLEFRQNAKISTLQSRNRRLLKVIRKRTLIKKHLNRMKPGKWSLNLNPLSAIINNYLLKRKRFTSRKPKWKKRKLKWRLLTRRRRLKTLLIKTENVDNFKSFQNIEGNDSSTNWDSTLRSLNRNLLIDSIKLSSAAFVSSDIRFAEQTINRGSFSNNTLSFNCEHLLFNLFFLNTLIKNQTMFKYVLYKITTQLNKSSYNLSIPAIKPILHNLETFYFGSRWDALKNSNLYPLPHFNFSIQRRLISLFTFRRFSTYTSIWYLNMLVRFVEFCTGRKVYIKLNPFVEKTLLLVDQIQCRIWETRVSGFQRILGPKLFLKESLRILMIALKYKDPTFLINWIKAMLYRMSFWKYRALFRYIKFVLKNLFEPNFQTLGLRGFKVKLKGKISVAGNARTRTLLFKVGRTSHSKFNNKVAHSFTLINSFTGVMGFNLWIFF